ncbi:hypothetical protein BDP27DRAFT_236903 [Rhodocollybia butyracea]|uniref:Secreted protein n=1 Tax=Rhodocollybia butyracea TaxID=206335 RepID=A0A9P5U1B3_9AGAR|nr:hypothetical protein BDP27DRAFT_236903 [Rhodocollybia butyracea]
MSKSSPGTFYLWLGPLLKLCHCSFLNVPVWFSPSLSLWRLCRTVRRCQLIQIAGLCLEDGRNVIIQKQTPGITFKLALSLIRYHTIILPRTIYQRFETSAGHKFRLEDVHCSFDSIPFSHD